MILVGYGTEMDGQNKPIDYWIIQNSWDSRWGEKGFVRVPRGKNLCKIASSAMYPVMKSSLPKPLQPISPPNICGFTKDIYQSGVYQKSICTTVYTQTYDDSRDYCLQHGMQLYRTDSYELNLEVFKSLQEKWPNLYTFYVEGKTATECSNVNNIDDLYSKYTVGVGKCEDRKTSICEFYNAETSGSTEPEPSN
jgi:Papain family cysteine protease